jgi:uncharacterized protein YndB with AHSA1/START domain
MMPKSIPVRVTQRFAAPQEQVFDAWLDADNAGRWLFATPGGRMMRVEIDPREGGRFAIVERRGDQDAEHFGTYLEIQRPRRLVFSFSAERDSRKADPVTIEVVPIGSGCELTLTHQMQPEWAEYAVRTQEGWAQVLQKLANLIGRT